MSAPTAEVTASSATRPSGSTATGSAAGPVAAPARPPVVRATPEEIAAQAAAVEAWKVKPDAPLRALLVE